METITLTQEFLGRFLKWGGHIVFTNSSWVPVYRGNIESFRFQENRLAVSLTGVETNQWGMHPKWAKANPATKELEIDLATYSSALNDHSGIYLAHRDTSNYKLVDMKIV